MAITCRVIADDEDHTPLAGLPVSLKCVDFPSYRFESMTDNNGAVNKWYPSNQGRGLGQLCWVNSVNHSRWCMVFNTHPPCPPDYPFPRLRVDFYVSQESQHQVTLLLSTESHTYAVSQDNTPLEVPGVSYQEAVDAFATTERPMLPSGLEIPDDHLCLPPPFDRGCHFHSQPEEIDDILSAGGSVAAKTSCAVEPSTELRPRSNVHELLNCDQEGESEDEAVALALTPEPAEPMAEINTGRAEYQATGISEPKRLYEGISPSSGSIPVVSSLKRKRVMIEDSVEPPPKRQRALRRSGRIKLKNNMAAEKRM